MVSHLDDKLSKLAEQTQERWGIRKQQLMVFGAKGPSLIAMGIYPEALVHLAALGTITWELIGEFRAWIKVFTAPSEDSQSSIRNLADKLAFESLKACSEVIGADQTDKLIELSMTITSKIAQLAGSALPGLEPLVKVTELIEAIKEIKDVSGLQYRDERIAAKVLAELELFMMTSLSASWYAAAQVHAFTKPLQLDCLGTFEASEAVSKEARSFVVEHFRATRGKFNPSHQVAFIHFPDDGLWPDSNLGRVNTTSI